MLTNLSASLIKNGSFASWHKIAGSAGRVCSLNHRRMSVATQKPLFLYVCGKGDKGQLGLGSSVSQVLVPTRVKTEGAVVDVSCGKNFTVFVTEKGSVYTMGENENGSVLGNESVSKSSFEPVKVDGLDGVKIRKVAAGQKHILALAEDGSVFSWGCAKALSAKLGSSSIGVLGHGDKESRARPTRIEGLKGVKVKHIACGGQHSAVLAEGGAVYTWGLGEQVLRPPLSPRH
jgi:alpha-tubulin suppressor-like RCC1 family protein